MKRHTSLKVLGLLIASGIAAVPHTAAAGDILLQYFESKWETMERRMPDVFVAGYGGLWVPPPAKADSGGYSVGYDVFDRFFLGNPYDRTLYGTEQGFRRLSQEMDRAGISLFVDVVLNHNGFRDGGTPGFVESGDYPGFVVRLPNDIDGDFHGSFAGGDLEGRLAGLIDIAQEKNHVFTRHPIPGSPNPIPNETPRESNRMLYPDRDLPAEFGRHPYNLADPMAGDPTQENATGLLMRYMQWLVEVHGVDGFRIDAVKHMPTWFYTNYYDPTVYNLAKNPIDGSRYTPFSFGENFSGSFDTLNAYVRKDGYGNRDTLDFPLFFALQGVFDAGGFGDMRTIENASYDSSDGFANDGTRGVMFAGSHDTFGAGQFNGFNNMPNAHILTRAGYPLIYYNAREFGDGRDFPKDGRGDALGNYGDTITSLTRLNKTHIRNTQFTRWIDSDIYIYERLNAALVGISDRGDQGFDERNVFTGFAPGTVLVELTGNATSAFIDPNNDIFDQVTVDGNGRVSIRVPRVKAANGNQHGRAYVVYGPAVPAANLTFVNQTAEIGPDPDDGRRQAERRLTPLSVVKDNFIDVKLDVTTTATTPSDNSLIKVNYGQVDVDGSGTRNPSGEFAGFESFPAAPAVNGSVKTYTARIDATQLPEGYNYFQTVSFLQRPANSPPLYSNVRKVVYLDRLAPTQNLAFPARTGNRDITSSSYEAVVQTDHTVNRLHMLINVPQGLTNPQIVALCTDANRARHHDRLEWRQVLSSLPNGLMELTVVALEETGTASIQRYGNIGVAVPMPELRLGIDTDNTPGAVTFADMPGTVNSAALANEVVLRVRAKDVDAEGRDLVFGTDYIVSLTVNGTKYDAVGYDAALLPPVGRLVQNDQNLGDEYDEFRFLWRGYTRGQHTFTASAKIINPDTPATEAVASVTVPESVAGPAITLARPAAGAETVNNPATLLVSGQFTDSTAAFAQVFIDLGGRSVLLRQYDAGVTGLFAVNRPVGSFSSTDVIASDALPLTNGTFPVRVVASTGPNGTGIVTEVSGTYTVTGLSGAPTRAPLVIDGNAEDVLANAPAIAVSMADGGSGTALPADFGADGTNTQLHATVRGDTLYAAVRGDYFGATDTNVDNVTLVLIDKAFGSAAGVKNVPGDLEDLSDGLRSDISKAEAGLTQALRDQGAGFDVVVGITTPAIGYGYSFGSDGTQGSFTNFQFQPNIAVKFDADVAAVTRAAGTSYNAPNAFEFSVPMALLGNDPSKLRFAVISSADFGYGSPNTLPENASDAFGATPNFQFIEALAALPTGAGGVLLNEIGTGDEDRVELVNTTGASISLAGWALLLRDSSGYAMDYSFPADATVPANGYLVISDRGGVTPPSPQAGYLFTGFNISWDEGRGGSAALVDPAGLGRDFVAWRDVDNSPSTDLADVPAGTTFTGTVVGARATLSHSLGRSATSTDTNAAADWENTSGADASVPTFGARNQSAANSRDQFIVY